MPYHSADSSKIRVIKNHILIIAIYTFPDAPLT